VFVQRFDTIRSSASSVRNNTARDPQGWRQAGRGRHEPATPGGATEVTLFAHGFWRELLAGLVLAGLATVTTAFMRAGGPAMRVDRYRITAAGRRAIEG
jgi:hypothetical protein